jgi:two-component system response regulator YesN
MEVEPVEETTVLIVEDESLIMQDILALYDWHGAGYRTVTAANGVQALQRFAEERPRLVLTDVRMPHMDGLAMIERIRAIAPETRFIILSAYSDFEYARQGMRLGVSEYILKRDLTAQTIQAALDRVFAPSPQTPTVPAGAEDKKLSPIVERAAAYIRENYQRPELRIGGIALACGISAGRLSVRFRDEMDTTVNEYVTFVRMEKAKQLLASGKYHVGEVADLVGYRDKAYFSTLFQSRTGVKPNKYHR